MAYTPPNGNAVDFTLSGVAYTPPAGNAVAFEFLGDVVSIQPPLLAGSGAPVAPSVTAGAVTLSPSLLASAGAPAAPAVGTVAHAPRLTGSGVPIAPAVTYAAQALAPGLFEGSGAPLAPTVIRAARALLAPLVAGEGAPLLPQVLADVFTITAPLVAGGGTVTTPAVSSLVKLSPTLIGSSFASVGHSVVPGPVVLSPERLLPTSWCKADVVFHGGRMAGRSNHSDPTSYDNGVFVLSTLRQFPTTTVRQSVASAAASSPTVFTR